MNYPKNRKPRQFKPKSIKERFNQVDKMFLTESGCLIWMGATFISGYGFINHGIASKKRIKIRAHRVAWELENGEIPNGLDVLHH